MRNIEAKIRELLVDQLGVAEDEVTLEATLRDDLGADSLDAVEIGITLEEEFEIEVSDDDIEQMQTVADVIKFVEAKVSQVK